MLKSRLAEFWRVRRKDIGALASITMFFVVFFWRALLTGKFFVTSDAFIYSYPLRTLVWQQLRSGKLPLWTTQIMSGYPLLSMAQIGIGYPLTWCYLFLPGRFAETIYDLAPYLLFPIFIYCYLREVNRSRLAAILAALAFGYGGFLISPVAYNGLLGNALMWLPLLLITLERARTRPFIHGLSPATLVYSLSVLTGVGQGFLLTGLVAVAYACFLGMAVELPKTGDGESSRMFWSVKRWRPLAVMLCAIFVSAGVAAFQILETLQAHRLSIRSQLSFDLFAAGSFHPLEALKAIYLPLYYHLEASGYVAPVVLVLAGVAIVAAAVDSERDPRVFFWLALAICGFVLTLGRYSPVFGLLYQFPVISLFRGASRHAFELTLGIAVLSAYGWDASRALAERRISGAAERRWSNRALSVTVLLLLLLLALGIVWLKGMAGTPIGEMEVYYYPPAVGRAPYGLWKSLSFVLSLVALWQAWKLKNERVVATLSLGVIVIACFFEPAILAARWWWPTLKPASRFITASPTTEFLQKYPSEQNRVYSFAYPFIEEYVTQPRLEPSNLTILHGLQDVAGYEPLILERYSRALGDTYVEAIRPRPGYAGDQNIFASSSHVLDLLNTRFVVSYPYLSTEPATPILKEGIKFSNRDLDKLLQPGQKITLEGVAADADTLALVTATAFSANEPDGTEVARVRLFSLSGKTVERSLRIGIDTAEWAHDRPEVRANVRHSLAPVFSGSPGDLSKYTFQTRLQLGESLAVDHLEITNVSPNVVVILNKATLFNSKTNFSMPLPHYDLNKWQPVYDDGRAQILQNKNALPRAWLVAEAESVDGEEALRRIRGQGTEFDPRRTALLEVLPRDLPVLSGGPISPRSAAKIVADENNSVTLDTVADTASLLVLSEVNYPGWVARIDGAPTTILTADYLLRGIVLPPGSHRVEMRYTAPAARKGAFISVFTLVLVCGLAFYVKRTKNH